MKFSAKYVIARIRESFDEARKREAAGKAPADVYGDYMTLRLILCEIQQTSKVRGLTELGRFDRAWGIDSLESRSLVEAEQRDREREARRVALYHQEAEQVRTLLPHPEDQRRLNLVLAPGDCSRRRHNRARAHLNRALLKAGHAPAWLVAGAAGLVAYAVYPPGELVPGARDAYFGR
jgi:hypothetical protein